MSNRVYCLSGLKVRIVREKPSKTGNGEDYFRVEARPEDNLDEVDLPPPFWAARFEFDDPLPLLQRPL